ncbi:MAG: hypothetical protein QXF61_07570 [Nitrososphaeria archaeon]
MYSNVTPATFCGYIQRSFLYTRDGYQPINSIGYTSRLLERILYYISIYMEHKGLVEHAQFHSSGRYFGNFILLVFAPSFLGHYYLSVLRTILMWAALTISWYFFSGLTRYISLGSSVFFGAGLYFTVLYLNFSIIEGRWPLLPFPAIVLIAGLLNFGICD